MLNSLEIKNYRNLKHLQIQKLGRVNLIVGKNNTGKTSVLEAISIHLYKGSFYWILKLLEEREEYRNGNNSEKSVEENIKVLANLHYNRDWGYDIIRQIQIGDKVEMSNKNELNNISNVTALGFVEYHDQVEERPEGNVRKRVIGQKSLFDVDSQIGYQIIYHANNQLITLNRSSLRPMLGNDRLLENIQFVRTKNISREENGSLWDKIVLTPNENIVVEALTIIEPNIERVSFIGTDSRASRRLAVAKIKNQEPVPISSMGDGINRILTIILAIVNCKDGYILIDEFENGLHHSVQGKLWEVIFYLSQKLNIQVFATTHSSDSVRSFAQTLKDKKLPEEFGCLVRLENHDGNVIAREYDYNVLQSATEYNIETR
jgi:AAA15 family ATPase/GTPase